MAYQKVAQKTAVHIGWIKLLHGLWFMETIALSFFEFAVNSTSFKKSHINIILRLARLMIAILVSSVYIYNRV